MVRLMVPQDIYPVVAGKCAEVMVYPLPSGSDGQVGEGALRAVEEQMQGISAVVIGPGLGTGLPAMRMLAQLLEQCHVPVVVDADALNLVARHGLSFGGGVGVRIATPHPGEMARLLGRTVADVQSDRIGVATGCAAEHGIVVVLKGSGTVVSSPDAEVWVGPKGVVSLATAGSGDVLAGVLGALVAAKDYEAGRVAGGVALHAVAGMLAQQGHGIAGVLASDLLDVLPAAQELLRARLSRQVDMSGNGTGGSTPSRGGRS